MMPSANDITLKEIGKYRPVASHAKARTLCKIIGIYCIKNWRSLTGNYKSVTIAWPLVWNWFSSHNFTECKLTSNCDQNFTHDDVIKWKNFPHYWSFVRGIHQSPVNYPHKDQWRRALMFSLICTWRNVWENNHEAGDLRRHRAHYDVNVMSHNSLDSFALNFVDPAWPRTFCRMQELLFF